MRSLVFSDMPMESEKFPTNEEIVRQNLFQNNVGNEYFFNAVVKSLQCNDHEICRYLPTTDFSTFDQGLIINANQIADMNLPAIKYQYGLVSKSELPYICICVGSDSDHQFRTTLNEDTKEYVYKLYSTILDRSVSMGVRGELTKQVLVNEVGLPANKIDVIGCPSVRYWGTKFEKYPRDYPEFNNNLKIAVNYTAYSFNYEEALYLALVMKSCKNSYMIFTDKEEADMLWYHKEVSPYRRHEILPSDPNHPYISRCRFTPVQKNMMGMLKSFDFSIGSRIHQAIISILSGCPAIVIAHSSRVLELAQHHHIPYILRSELTQDFPPLEDLYYRACKGMKDFYENYDRLLKEYTDFLQKNNLIVNKDFLY